MILREWSTLSGKRDSTPAKFVDSLLGRRLMKKGIVPLKERIQTFFTKGVCRPTGSYHEESCDITLLSTRWTTSTHCSASFCGSACLPLFTLVPSPSPTHPFTSSPTGQPKPTLKFINYEKPDIFFFIVICSSCVELFDRKIAGIDQKNRKRSRQRWGVFSW